jgi:hypothetical protein
VQRAQIILQSAKGQKPGEVAQRFDLSVSSKRARIKRFSTQGLLGIGFATLSGESIGVLFSLYVASLLFISAGLLAYILLRPRFLKIAAVEGRV